MMMDELLPLLPTLVHLGRTASVSQTARELGVPRSTVSRRLSRMEELLAVKLAERTTHRLRLTGAGRKLVEGAASALARLDTVREQMMSAQNEVRGVLRVAMPPGVAGAFLGWFLAYLHAEHAGIDIELVVTEKPPRGLDEGFDIVLVMGTPEASPWLRRKLTSVDIIAVASSSYLGERPPPTRVEELAQHTLLTWLTPGHAPTWPKWKGNPVPIKPKLVTNDISMLREMALAGIGIAMLPEHVVLNELSTSRLTPVLPQVLGASIDVFALYPPERRASPVLRAVLEAVRMFAEVQNATVRPKRR
ncbi:MAG: hypothetical protein DI536_08880 [Archangium gephyra]|uniref:HTH lysR-type domain-containing protein n=1 Tax=Archangium gephyra TaxID=48 RepID=A0A2W5TH45_9BACT|nr:MAG: hypothetical protein DI536_08880 [Archangium gephyra]